MPRTRLCKCGHRLLTRIVSLYENCSDVTIGRTWLVQARPLDTWPCAASPPSVSSNSITLLYTLFSLRRLRSCVWLTDWLTDCGQQQAKQERAAASRQPISWSGLANVPRRGSSTTVSATARATSTQTGILRRQREGTFRRTPLFLHRGSIPCCPVLSLSRFLSPPDTAKRQSVNPTPRPQATSRGCGWIVWWGRPPCSGWTVWR